MPLGDANLLADGLRLGTQKNDQTDMSRISRLVPTVFAVVLNKKNSVVFDSTTFIAKSSD